MPPHIEKIQVMLTDGREVYVNFIKEAKKLAVSDVRAHAGDSFHSVAWIDDDECFAVDNANNMIGTSVMITPMLIPLDNWNAIIENSVEENSQMLNTMGKHL